MIHDLFNWQSQSSYYDNELWSFFKILDKHGAKFILFSSYGSAGPFPVLVKSGTPPIFQRAQRISLQWEGDADTSTLPVGLLLNKAEAEDLIARFCANQYTKPTIAHDLQSTLVVLSGGHAGALAGLLETVAKDSARITLDVSEVIMLISSLDYLSSSWAKRKWISYYSRYFP